MQVLVNTHEGLPFTVSGLTREGIRIVVAVSRLVDVNLYALLVLANLGAHSQMEFERGFT